MADAAAQQRSEREPDSLGEQRRSEREPDSSAQRRSEREREPDSRRSEREPDSRRSEREREREPDVKLYFAANKRELEETVKVDGMQGYVMLQNDRLHADNAALRDKLAAMNRKLSDSVFELTAVERSRNCLRGIVHNKLEESEAQQLLCGVYRSKLAAARDAMRVGMTAVAVVAPVTAVAIARGWNCAGAWCAVARAAALLAYAAAMQRSICRMRGLADEESDPEVCALRTELFKVAKANRMLHDLADNL